MKKILIIMNCILSYFCFIYFKDFRSLEQAPGFYKKDELYQFEFIFTNYSEKKEQEFIHDTYSIIKEYNVAILARDYNPDSDALNFFIAGNDELTKLQVPLRSSEHNSIDFMEMNDLDYYTNTNGWDSDIYIFQNDEIYIYPLNQSIYFEKSYMTFSFYSRNQQELEIVKSIIDSKYEIDLIESNDYSYFYDNDDRNIMQSLTFVGLAFLLVISFVLIDNLSNEKQVLIRKLNGQSPSYISFKLNIKMLLTSVISLIISFSIILFIHNVPINEYTVIILYDFVIFLLLIIVSYIVVIIIMLIFIGLFKVRQKWIFSEKIILIIMTIFISYSIISLKNNIHSLMFSYSLYVHNYSVHSAYNDYNIIGSIVGSGDDFMSGNIEPYVKSIKEIEDNNTLLLPSFISYIYDMSDPNFFTNYQDMVPKGITLITDNNYINNLDLLDNSGNKISIDDDDCLVIIEEDLYDYAKKSDPNRFSSSCEIHILDDINLSHVNVDAAYFINKYINELSYMLVVNQNEFSNIENRYITKLDEHEIQSIFDNNGTNYKVEVNTVDDFYSKELNSNIYYIISNSQLIVISLFSVFGLIWLYANLYTKKYNRECVIKNSLGQNIILVHKELLFDMILSLILVSYVIYRNYVNTKYFTLILMIVSLIYIFGIIVCFYKNNNRRIK